MSAFELSDRAADDAAGHVQPEHANAVLFHYGPTTGLMEPGSFVQALITAIARADPYNRARLGLGFPGYVAAVRLAEGRMDGMERLHAICGRPAGQAPA